MKKSELASEMKKYVGGGSFVGRKELAGFMGYSDPESIDKYLYGLDKKGRKYFIQDVAENICDMTD